MVGNNLHYTQCSLSPGCRLTGGDVGRPSKNRTPAEKREMTRNRTEKWRQNQGNRGFSHELATNNARKQCGPQCRHKNRLRKLQKDEHLAKKGRYFVHPTASKQMCAVAVCGPKLTRDYVKSRVLYIHTGRSGSWAVFETRQIDQLNADHWAAPIDRCFVLEECT